MTMHTDTACATCRRPVLDSEACSNERDLCTSCCDCHADEAAPTTAGPIDRLTARTAQLGTPVLIAAIRTLPAGRDYPSLSEAERMATSVMFDTVAARHNLWTWLDDQPDELWDLPDHDVLKQALWATAQGDVL